MKTKAGIQIASMAALALPLVMAVGCAGNNQNLAQTDAADQQAVQAATASMDIYMAQLDQQQENTDEEVSNAVTQTDLSAEEAVTPVSYEQTQEETPLQETEITAVTEEAVLPETEIIVSNSEVVSLEAEGASDSEEVGQGEEKYMLPAPQQMTFYFDSNSDIPADSDLDTLLQHAQYLKAHPNMVLVINGHSDSRGSQVYNQRLSEQRAVNVAYVLMEAGVSGAQLQLEGMGEAVPRIDPANFQENRRVEFTYLDSMMAKN